MKRYFVRFGFQAGHRTGRRWIASLILTLCLGLSGCGAFGSGFASVLDGGSGAFASVENAPGHVVIAFVNNAEVDELLLSYLESAEGGSLVLTDAEKRRLRPRVRFRVEIVFTDGTPLTLEFVSGSTKLVQPDFAATSQAVLNQGNLDNAVVACDVASVEVRVDTVEVFVPTQWRTFDLVAPTPTTVSFFRETGRNGPEFVQLQVDDVDPATLTATVQRNISIRDLPAPVNNPSCGSVVTIVLNGTLSVPFVQTGQGVVPGWDVLDTDRAALNGGRFEFQVSIQR